MILLSNYDIKPDYLFFLDFFFFCGTGDGTQGHSTSEPHPQSYFLFFILKQGLTKLLRLAANPDPPVSAS